MDPLVDRHPKIDAMPLLGPLQRLQDLDRSSRNFSNQLTDILSMEDCMNQAQNLQYGDLQKLVEDLDHVCVHLVVTCFLLSSVIGPQRP